jgi:hypothetical protein
MVDLQVHVQIVRGAGGRRSSSSARATRTRATARRHFVAKCSAYLQAGVSVVIVDVVTGRYENLYTLLLDSLGVNHDPVAPRSLYGAG